MDRLVLSTHVEMKNENFWTDEVVEDFFVEYPEDEIFVTVVKKYVNHLNNSGIELSKTAEKILFRQLANEDFAIVTGKTLICDRGANYCGYQYMKIVVELIDFDSWTDSHIKWN